MWNMERIGLTASEEMSFETVDGRRTPDTCLYYKLIYEPTAQVSSKLRHHFPHYNPIKVFLDGQGQINMLSVVQSGQSCTVTEDG